jgi:chemotaxis protein CheD
MGVKVNKMNKEHITISTSELHCIKENGVLITHGIGSCVAIGLYDPINKIAGLAHCMLPDSKETKDNSNSAKFVDTATLKLINDMLCLGAEKSLLEAKVAGGASMFPSKDNSNRRGIGDRNIEAAVNILAMLGIPIVERCVGNIFARSVEFFVDDGYFNVRIIKK